MAVKSLKNFKEPEEPKVSKEILIVQSTQIIEPVNPRDSLNANLSVNPLKSEKMTSSNDTTDEEESKKTVNKIILCQIHLCRFMYKMMVRLRKSAEKQVLQYNPA